MSRNPVSHHSRAVVTGAGGGIGRAFAWELHQRGGKVVCADIALAAAEETARSITGDGGQALAVQCDVADLEAVRSLASQARDWFGEPTNLLINNAGVGVGGREVEDIDMDTWHWIMGVNLWGVIHGCNVFLPEIKQHGVGGVINVASAASFGSAPRMGAYNATKAAVLGLTETLHAENAGTGIHVTTLCPTLVKTDIIRNARMNTAATGSIMDPDRAQALMDRFGHSPESVARKTLDGLDKNRVHIMPQLDARIAWNFKRLSPENFIRFSGFMSRRFG